MTARAGHRCPLLATDLLLEYAHGGREGLVLVTRKNPPYGLALPGGFAEEGLTLEENAHKEAREETGLDVVILDAERPFCVHSDPGRDPRGHLVSVAYRAHGTGTLRAGDDAASAHLYTYPEIEALLGTGALAFDHARILQKYLTWREERR